jgi:phytoene dehydrogenase-like protein
MVGGAASSCAYALHLLHERVIQELEIDVQVRPLRPSVMLLPDGSLRETASGPLWAEAARELDPFLLGRPPSPEKLGPVCRRYSTQSIRALLEEYFDSAEHRAVNAPPYFEGEIDEPGGPLAYAWLETSACREPTLQGLPARDPGEMFAEAAERAGAAIELRAEVVSLVDGVLLADGRRLAPATVVSCLDPIRTYHLAGRGDLAACFRRGPGAAKLDLFLSEQPLLATKADIVFLIPDLQWWKHNQSPIELQLGRATEGQLSVYVPRADSTLNPDDLIALVRTHIPDIRLERTQFRGPTELEAELGLTGGGIHHLPHIPAHMWWNRPTPTTPLPSLYLGGAGTHPGGEVSGVPGWNAAQTVLGALMGNAAAL